MLVVMMVVFENVVAGVLVVMVVRAGSVGPPSSASGVKPVEPAALQSETDCRPVHIAAGVKPVGQLGEVSDQRLVRGVG